MILTRKIKIEIDDALIISCFSCFFLIIQLILIADRYGFFVTVCH